MRKLFLFLAALTLSFNLFAQTKHTTNITNLSIEHWWGIDTNGEFSVLPDRVTMLVSSAGRYIWNKTPMSAKVGKETIVIISDTQNIEPVKAGRTLREAYLVCFHKNVKSADTLSSSNRQAEIEAAIRLDGKVEEYIKELSSAFVSTGEPALRPIEYMFPYDGFADCRTQYLIGTRYLVVSLDGKSDKVMVRFPKGKWLGNNGAKIEGPRVIEVPVSKNPILLYELSK